MEIRRRPPNPKVRVAHLEYAVPHDDEEPRPILEKIVWEKDREIDAARDKVPLDNLKQQIAKLPPTKDFLGALQAALHLWSQQEFHHVQQEQILAEQADNLHRCVESVD